MKHQLDKEDEKEIKERINDKIKEIEKYIEELLSIIPKSFEEYEKDFKTKAACERYFDKIIEAAVDLAFFQIRKNKLFSPDDDTGAFLLLGEKGIIGKELASRLTEAKKMRNFIVHRYKFVDDLIVFNSINDELRSDIKEFIKSIENTIKKS